MTPFQAKHERRQGNHSRPATEPTGRRVGFRARVKGTARFVHQPEAEHDGSWAKRIDDDGEREGNGNTTSRPGSGPSAPRVPQVFPLEELSERRASRRRRVRAECHPGEQNPGNGSR